MISVFGYRASSAVCIRPPLAKLPLGSLLPFFSARQLSGSRSARNEASTGDNSAKERTQGLTQAADEGKKLASSEEDAGKAIQSNFNLNSIFLLSIPITTRKSFIYCHHNAGLLNRDQLDAVPWLMKMEKKLVGLAKKAWDKLVTSDLSVNKKIVSLVSRLLSSIPYNENCLRSFPSKETMVRETAAQHIDHLPKAVMTSEIDEKNVSLDQLKPIPVYHSQLQDPQTILKHMNEFKTELASHHRKWAILSAIGIPVSLPVALVPVVPNVPGFYLAYRLYCHLQALRGAKNLGFLLENDSSMPDSASQHLTFQHHPDLDGPFQAVKSKSDSTEHMLLDSEAVDELVQTTGLSEIKEDLYRAFKQETKRLKKLEEKSD